MDILTNIGELFVIFLLTAMICLTGSTYSGDGETFLFVVYYELIIFSCLKWFGINIVTNFIIEHIFITIFMAILSFILPFICYDVVKYKLKQKCKSN